MRSPEKNRIWLMLIVIGASSSALVSMADEPVSTASESVHQVANLLPESANGSSGVVPASFLSHSDMRDTVVDNCEDLKGPLKLHSLMLHPVSSLGRCFHGTKQPVPHKHDSCPRWFHYIRGQGPAVWDFY